MSSEDPCKSPKLRVTLEPPNHLRFFFTCNSENTLSKNKYIFAQPFWISEPPVDLLTYTSNSFEFVRCEPAHKKTCLPINVSCWPVEWRKLGWNPVTRTCPLGSGRAGWHLPDSELRKYSHTRAGAGKWPIGQIEPISCFYMARSFCIYERLKQIL